MEKQPTCERPSLSLVDGRVREIGLRFIVCNIDGSTKQKQFRIHKKLEGAVEQARKLAFENPAAQFMIMEPIGGYINTAAGLVELRVPVREGGVKA